MVSNRIFYYCYYYYWVFLERVGRVFFFFFLLWNKEVLFLNEEMCGYLSVLPPLVLKQFEERRTCCECHSLMPSSETRLQLPHLWLLLLLSGVLPLHASPRWAWLGWRGKGCSGRGEVVSANQRDRVETFLPQDRFTQWLWAGVVSRKIWDCTTRVTNNSSCFLNLFLNTPLTTETKVTWDLVSVFWPQPAFISQLYSVCPRESTEDDSP